MSSRKPIQTLALVRKVFQLLSVFAASMLSAAAEKIESVPEIGMHQRVLIVKKNVHPQNLLIAYTKLDANGRFLTDHTNQNRPMLDFYWLMDGTTYKPVNARIKNEIAKRLECQLSPTNRSTQFIININDLKEVNTDIEEPRMDVYASGSGGVRAVQAQMNLGPSNGNMRIKLSSIYTEGRVFPPAVYSVTLEGEEIVDGKLTGKKVTRRYEAKNKPE